MIEKGNELLEEVKGEFYEGGSWYGERERNEILDGLRNNLE